MWFARFRLQRRHPFIILSCDLRRAGATESALQNLIAFGINNSGDITGGFTNMAGAVFGYILIQGTFHRISIPATALTSVHGAEDNGRAMTGDVVKAPTLPFAVSSSLKWATFSC